MFHVRSKGRRKKPALKPKTVAKAVKVPEAKPQAAAEKLSPFYATGPARPLAAPGPKKAAAPAAGPMTKKVAVGQPGDRYEKEADAVADKVARGTPAPDVSHLPAGGLKAQSKEEETDTATETAAQTKEAEKGEDGEDAGPVQEKQEGEETETAQAKESEGADEVQEKGEDEVGEEATGAAQAKEAEEGEEEAVQSKEAEETEGSETEDGETEAAQTQEAGEETAGEEKAEGDTVQQMEAGSGETEEKTEEDAGDETAQAKKQQQEEEEEIQELSSRDEARERKQAAAGRAIQERGTGEPLSAGTRSTLESGLGADLSGVRVHRDGRAQQAAKDMGARAFTHKNNIWLGPGESASDTRLMAHEATHVLQQGGVARKPPARPGPGRSAEPSDRGVAPPPSATPAARPAMAGPPAVQRKSAAGSGGKSKSAKAKGAKGGAAKKGAPPPSTGDVAPEELELLGQVELPSSEPVASWLQGRKRRRGPVPVRFGQMAKGQVEMSADRKGRFKIHKKEAIPLQHDLFRRIGDAAPELEPSLILEAGRKVQGYAGLKAGKRLPSSRDLQKKLAQYPVLLGIPGFELPKLAHAKSLSKIEAGHLEYGIEETPVSFGALFNGSIGFQGRDDKITTFTGRLAVHAQGLAEGELELHRDTAGNVEGKATVDLDLPAGFSGGVTVEWKDDAVTGEGRVGYAGEKLSGHVTLRLMDKEKATQLEEQKKAPPEGTEEPAAAPAEGKSKKGKKTKKKGKQEFVVFGEGDLNFAFTEWLNGTAHVIVDPEGHVTIIGKITPQKEYELFPQKDYDKKIFEVEPRLTYGLPVVGNIFIFANVSLRAFATIGPAKLYNIQVDGTYSTDPETMQSFSIQGTLKMSAAAGLKLRGEAGAGITIMRHSIKAGAGLTGIAGIRGYAEATPIIGYREKPAGDGTDKKGEFYIRGDVEIAAQPFLGLEGDLFIKLDSPWWSPAPDKTWSWPLGDVEYPIGGSVGVGASVDFVFGSGAWPKVEMKEVDFSAEKFMSDLYHDNTQPKSGAGGDKKGAWKEKNQKAAEPPPKESATGDMKPGKGPEAPPPKPKQVAKKKKGKDATPDARTAEGKTVKQLKKEASRKGRKGKEEAKGTPDTKAKAPGAGADAAPGEDASDAKASITAKEKERELLKRKAADVVAKAMAGGIRKSRLLALLEDLKKKYRLEQATLDNADDVTLRNSPPVSMKGRRALAVESSSLATVNKKGKEEERYTKKSPTGDKQVGTFASSAPRSHTLFGVLKPHLRSLGFDDLSAFPTEIPVKAPRPDKVQAELWYKVPIGDTARDATATKAVGHLGDMESRVFGRGPQNYEGGHLIGHQFAGPEIFQNLVPQRGNEVNRGLYAKIENFVESNLPEKESRDTHVKMTVWSKYTAGRPVDMEALSDALLQYTGRQVTQKENLRSSMFSLDASLQGHLTAGPIAAEIRNAFAEKGVQLLPSARLAVKKTGKRWAITEEDPADKSSRRILVILLESGKLKVHQAKAEGYFLSKDIKQAAAGGRGGLRLPSRIPNTIEAEVEVTGIKDVKLPKVAKTGEAKGGSTLSRSDYVIVPETGPASDPMSEEKLQEVIPKTDAPEKKKVRTRFDLTGN